MPVSLKVAPPDSLEGSQQGPHRYQAERSAASKKVHVFEGQRVQIDKPKGAPAWMPDKIWKPIVKKAGIETLMEI